MLVDLRCRLWWHLYNLQLTSPPLLYLLGSLDGSGCPLFFLLCQGWIFAIKWERKTLHFAQIWSKLNIPACLFSPASVEVFHYDSNKHVEDKKTWPMRSKDYNSQPIRGQNLTNEEEEWDEVKKAPLVVILSWLRN